jgi:hypothetical protein
MLGVMKTYPLEISAGFKRLWAKVQVPRFSSPLAYRLNKEERKKETEAVALQYQEVAGAYTTNFKPLAEAFVLSFLSRG